MKVHGNTGKTAYNKGQGRGYKWLLAHVDFDGEGCLTWPFTINRFWGRGTFGLDGEVHWAHRYMCKLVHGDPPPDKPYAAHECGNGHLACVHPKHVFWKTSSENAVDRRLHGRREGANGTRTYLTPAQVMEIRESKGKVAQFALAEKFQISRGSVEYWQRKTHEPLPFAMDAVNIKKRSGYYKDRTQSERNKRRASRISQL